MTDFVPMLIILHMVGLLVTAAAVVSMFNAGAVAAAGGTPTGLAKVTDRIVPIGHVGLAILWTTGPLAVWLKYGGVAGFGPWFWAKIVFVLILSGALGMGSGRYRKAKAGDAKALEQVRIVALVGVLAGIGAVICAGFAFR